MITCFYDVNIHLKGNYSCNNTVLEYSSCCCLFSCFFFTPCCVLWSTAPGVYAVVRCENDTVRSRVFKAEGNPEFNLRAIFYRRYPNTHISIEVWHIHPVCPLNMIHTHTVCTHNQPTSMSCVQLWSRGLLWDSVLGRARLQTTESERSRSLMMDLRGGPSRSGSRGCVYVETSSSVCLTDLWHNNLSSQVEADGLINKLCGRFLKI